MKRYNGRGAIEPHLASPAVSRWRAGPPSGCREHTTSRPLGESSELGVRAQSNVVRLCRRPLLVHEDFKPRFNILGRNFTDDCRT
jgi:hypothetical protein